MTDTQTSIQRVFPILKKNDAKATMFLIGSYIDRYGYLTADENI